MHLLSKEQSKELSASLNRFIKMQGFICWRLIAQIHFAHAHTNTTKMHQVQMFKKMEGNSSVGFLAFLLCSSIKDWCLNQNQTLTGSRSNMTKLCVLAYLGFGLVYYFYIPQYSLTANVACWGGVILPAALSKVHWKPLTSREQRHALSEKCS